MEGSNICECQMFNISDICCQQKQLHRAMPYFFSKESLLGTVYKRTSHGVLVRVTDAVVQHVNPESIFYFSMRHTDPERCDIILVSQAKNHLNISPQTLRVEFYFVNKLQFRAVLSYPIISTFVKPH